MTSNEKLELLKNTISHLYSDEGRSFSYISRLLEINRKTLTNKIKEWNLPEPKPHRYLRPSNQKFLNTHRNFIKSKLDNDVSMSEIARLLKVSRGFLLNTIVNSDEVLIKANEDYNNRVHGNAEKRRQSLVDSSYLNYDIKYESGEEWCKILGYEDYEISNCGRIRRYIESYKRYCLIKTYPNKNNGRIYVNLCKDNKRHGFQIARLVAFSFVDGYDAKHNTVNHEDGNVANNHSYNLTWTSQSENNKHAYDVLHRKKVRPADKKYIFSVIKYKDKYEFKTVASFARFLNKSETQTRRYLDEPERHNIKLIK